MLHKQTRQQNILPSIISTAKKMAVVAAGHKWEKELRRKLMDLLTASFRDNNSLSEELKEFAIQHHLLDDITNFIQNEHRLFDQKIKLCNEHQIQEHIDEICARKNYFFIGWLDHVSYELWQIQPESETSDKWKKYISRHQGAEITSQKAQTFYSHVSSGVERKTNELIKTNEKNLLCLNDGEQKKIGDREQQNKGVLYVLEYSKITYNILIAGDCLLNGIKSRQLHDFHNSDVVVFPRATSGDLFKNYTKQISRKSVEVLILHFGTYDLTQQGGEPNDTVRNLRNFVRKAKEKNPRIVIAVSSIVVRIDRKGVRSTIKSLNAQLKKLCVEENIDYINNDNIKEDMLSQKILLTLTSEGKEKLAENFSSYINKLM